MSAAKASRRMLLSIAAKIGVGASLLPLTRGVARAQIATPVATPVEHAVRPSVVLVITDDMRDTDWQALPQTSALFAERGGEIAASLPLTEIQLVPSLSWDEGALHLQVRGPKALPGVLRICLAYLAPVEESPIYAEIPFFTDANGDPLAFAVGTLPSWLSYNSSTHVLSGTPPVDNVGQFPVNVTVSDGRGGTLAATVTFDPVNPPPVAVDDTSSTAYLTPVIVPLTANDTDPDGDALTVVSASVDPAKGSVAFNGTDWVFTPAATFSGDAVIAYTIRDQDGATASAAHTVSVAREIPFAPLPPAPTPLPDAPRSDPPSQPVQTEGIVMETVRQVGSLDGISGRE